MSKRVAPVVIVLVLVAATTGYWLTERANGNGTIRVSGTVEATTVDASFKLPGRVSMRPVSGGENVSQGQVIASIDDREIRSEVGLRAADAAAAKAVLAELQTGTRSEEIARAEAAVRAAEARLKVIKKGPRRQEIAAARAAVLAAEAEADRASKERERVRALREQEAVSQSQYDSAHAMWVASSQRLAQAKAQLALMEEGSRPEEIEQGEATAAQVRAALALAKAGPRVERIDQARARLRQAEEALALARHRLNDTRLLAPVGGVVLSEHVEVGEYVAPGTPVVTLADLDRVWLRAYVDETDLGRVKLGEAVQVTTDTFPDKVYEGRVSFISSEAEFTPKNVQTHKERVKLVYRIKIDIPNEARELRPGMPADAVIAPGSDAR